MAASISGQEPGQVSGQVWKEHPALTPSAADRVPPLTRAKLDVLLVGDGAVRPLADEVQKLLSDLAAATVTVTVGDVQRAAELLAEREFQLVFLRATSPAAGEWEAARSLSSESLRNDAGLEPKAPLSDLERSQRISLLHSSKEKLRRERIKRSCEQLRALVPGGAGRKNDAASVLEATVEHVKRVRDRIPPAVLGQIAEALQGSSRFCKKQAPFQLPLPGPAAAPRENSVLAGTHPPVREICFPANRCSNVYPAPASGGPGDGSVRGPPSPAPEKAAGEEHQGQAPSPALSLGSFHALRCGPTVVPAWDTAAATSQSTSGPLPVPGPRAASCPAPHCSSPPGQACAAPPACPPPFWVFP